MRPTFDVSGYRFLLWSIPPLFVLAGLLLRRVRARLRTADPASLERLQRDGVLCGDVATQYGQLMRLLDGISPVVWLRERTSVRLYGYGIWLAYCWRPTYRWVQRELGWVAAYQAHRYARALMVVQQLRDDRTWGLQRPVKAVWRRNEQCGGSLHPRMQTMHSGDPGLPEIGAPTAATNGPESPRTSFVRWGER